MNIKCPDRGDCILEDNHCLHNGKCMKPIGHYTYGGMMNVLQKIRFELPVIAHHAPGNFNGRPVMIIHTPHGKYRIEAHPVD